MIKVRIDRGFVQDGYGIWIFDYDLAARKTFVAEPVELKFVKYNNGERLPEPTIFIKREKSSEFLRAFQDALSEAEIQTSKQDRRDREMLAVKNHLSDSIKIRDTLMQIVERVSL